jgi:hypothetical protein
MSDIIDIIHRLSYEVHDEALQRASASISGQIKEIDRLQNEIKQLGQQYAQTAATDTQARERIIRQITQHRASLRQLNSSLEDNILNNRELQQVLQREQGIIGALNTRLEVLRRRRDEATDVSSIRKFNREIAETSRELAGLSDSSREGSSSSVSSALGAFKGVVALGGISLGADALVDLGKKVVDTTAKYQAYQAVLNNTYGSQDRASVALKKLSDFAAKTPYQIDELTESFIKLKNRGFDPTTEELTNLGDLAASQGKSFDQLTEGILDAQTGEFERLKEFGIQARTVGNNVIFAFKGVETQVKKTDEQAIRNAIISMGKLAGVSGSMEAVSRTLKGKLSNLSDTVEQVFKNIGESTSGVISFAVDGLSSLASAMKEATEVPLSQKLGEQRAELNSLVTALMMANNNEELRGKIITEISSKYPEFLSLINAEKASTDQLADALSHVNEQYSYKIKMATLDERSQKVATQQQKLFNDQIEALENIQEPLQKLGVSTADFIKLDPEGQNKVIKQAIDLAKKEIDNARRDVEKNDNGVIDHFLIKPILGSVLKGQLDETLDNLLHFQDRFNSFTQKQNDIAEQKKALDEKALSDLKAKISEEEKDLSILEEQLATADKTDKKGLITLQNKVDAQRSYVKGLKQELDIQLGVTPKIQPKATVTEKDKNVFREKLQDLKTKLASITESVFQTDDTIREKVAEEVKKSQLETDNLYKDGKLTGNQRDILKALTGTIGDAQLKKELDDFNSKRMAAQQKIDDELNNLLIEESEQRTRLIQDDYDRQATLIDIEYEKQIDKLQKAKSALLKENADGLKTGLIDPETAKSNASEIERIYDDLLNTLIQSTNQKRAQLSLSLFDEASKYDKTFFTGEAAEEAERVAGDVKKLAGSYLQGRITYEKYQKELTKILNTESNNRRTLNIRELESELDLQQRKLEAAKGTASDNELNAIQTRINDLKAQIAALNQEESKSGVTENKTTKDEFSTTLKNRIKLFSDLSNAGIQAYQTIAQAQESQVTRDIENQQRRVDRAQAIADRGNAKALQTEVERLNTLQKEREKHARTQLAINSAQTLSSSILAIATAAGESGAGALVIVPAVIAALAAGFAAVKSLSNDTQGFRDGVIGLEGPGTTTSDSIPARLSRGESVITASGTVGHEKILEGMNAGKQYQLIDQNKIIEMAPGSNVPILQSIPIQGIAVNTSENNSDYKQLLKEVKSLREVIESKPTSSWSLDRKGFVAMYQDEISFQDKIRKL